MTAHFDTLQFTKTLTEAGIEPRHAEAIARAQARSLDELVGTELATKTDLAIVKAEVKAEIATTKAELKSDIATLRSEMKHEFAVVRSEMKNEIGVLRAELRADFQTELRSLKYGASIAMGLLSLIVVLTRFIR